MARALGHRGEDHQGIKARLQRVIGHPEGVKAPALRALRQVPGSDMVGSWRKQGGRYLCAIRSPRYAPGACTGRSLSAATIEQTVWEHVQALLAAPEILRQQYEQGPGDPAVDVRAEHERVRLERQLTALERAKTRLVEAYQAAVIELAAWQRNVQSALSGTGSFSNSASTERCHQAVII